MSDRNRSRRFHLETLEPRHLLSTGPRITEFMAQNVSTLSDEDGQFSDWIEIRNDSSATFDLGGWYLTDEETNLTKWRFAERSLAADEFVVVFASGKDRTLGDELHTNFRLNGGGEFLALVEPNGSTIASEFSSQIDHLADTSFGVSNLPSHSTELVYLGLPADILVPGDPPDSSWTTAHFQVGADWSAGESSIGYQRHSSTHSPASVLFVANTDLSGDAALGDQSVINRLRNVLGHTVKVEDDDSVSIVDAILSDLIVISSTVSSSALDARLVRVPKPIVHWEGEWNDDLQLSSSGSILPGQDSINMTSSGQGHPLAANLNEGSHTVRETPASFHTAGSSAAAPGMTWIANASNGVPAIGVVEAGKELNNGDPAPGRRITTFFGDLGLDGMNSTGLALFDAAIGYALEGDASAPNFREHFARDVQSLMFELSPSVLMRTPFETADVSDLAGLTLRMKYDDGFVAYLNGHEVARRNAPAAVGWNSNASSERSDQLAISFEDIDISQYVGLVNAGQNVLAIQGLNLSHDDGDFLLAAELVARGAAVPQHRLYTSPTPGVDNGVGFAGLVPDTRFSVDRGFFDEPFEVQIETDAPDANIRYTLDGSAPTEVTGMLYTGSIAIETTTTLRAIAFKADFIPSNVDTQTYIFVDDVLQQPEHIDGFPNWNIDVGRPNWGSSQRQSIPLHYGMDPEVINDPAYRDSARQSLLSIPTVSLVMDFDDLFGSRAFYNQGGSGSNANIERPVSVEIIDPNHSGEDVQVDAGIRPHSHLAPKRSLKLVFKSEYGDSKLKSSIFQTSAPLNGDSATDTFDRLIVRGGINRSFVNSWNPDDTTYSRDQWARDSQLAMSGVGARGTFVHLYLNGLYWGVYNTVERPDAFFVSTYENGQKDDYFAINHGGPISGDATRWNYLIGNLLNKDISVQDNYDELKQYLDVQQFADYLLLNWYAGTADWPQNNWYAVNRNLPDPGPMRFFAWDSEDTWDSRGSSGIFNQPGGRGNDGAWVHPDFTSDKTKSSADDSRIIAKLFLAARENPDFMHLFADRVHKHLFNDGALTDENSQARWQALNDFVREAIIAESARWGDARATLPGEEDVIRTRDDQWQAEVDRVKNVSMSGNVQRMMEALRAQGYYPAFDPPTFNQHGGSIAAGFQLSMTSADDSVDEIVLSLDGSDPRSGPVSVNFGSVLLDGSSAARVLVPMDDSLGTTWSSVEFDDSDWISGIAAVGFDLASTYDPLIGTNIETEMYLVNSTAYVRIPFHVDDPTSFNQLSLRMQYEDGIVAYLNGVEVLRDNLNGDSPAWNSRAQRGRLDSEAVEFRLFDLSEHLDVLRPGSNILAIQGLNSILASRDFLMVPQLSADDMTDNGRSPGAFTYVDPIELTQDTIVKARVLRDGQWSVLTEAAFVIGEIPTVVSNLRISEINYNPASPSVDEVAAGYDNKDDFEFIEFTNIGSAAINLANTHFTDGIDFTFTDISVLHGEFVVAVKNPEAFRLRYGDRPTIAGQYDGGLSDGGERLTVVDGLLGNVVMDFEYNDNDPWPELADGNGASLQLMDVATMPADQFGKPDRWRASTEYGGTPGAAGQAPIGVVVNEVLARTDLSVTHSDSIELYNSTLSPIDMGGWFLSDSAGEPLKYRIPDDTILQPGTYLVFDEHVFNPNPSNPGPGDFALNGTVGDDVIVTIGDGTGGVAQFVDEVHFGASRMGETLGRIPDGIGRLAPTSRLTLGCGNSDARVGPLVITEIQYSPGDPSPTALAVHSSLTTADLQYIEIYNPTNTTIDLTAWRVRGGADFDWGPGTLIGAGETVVILPFDPDKVTNEDRLRAFLAHYSIDESVSLRGGFSGQLNAENDRVVLRRPDDPSIENPSQIPYVTEDEALYDNLSPWPIVASGSGNTIHRTAPVFFGNAGIAWTADVASPGTVDFSGNVVGDLTGDRLANAADIDRLFDAVRASAAATYYDLDGSGTVDQSDVKFLVESILGSLPGDVNLDGSVDGMDFNLWSDHRFQSCNKSWAEGEFSGDGAVDGTDFNIWLKHRFTNAAAVHVANVLENQHANNPPRGPLDSKPTDLATDQVMAETTVDWAGETNWPYRSRLGSARIATRRPRASSQDRIAQEPFAPPQSCSATRHVFIDLGW